MFASRRANQTSTISHLDAGLPVCRPNHIAVAAGSGLNYARSMIPTGFSPTSGGEAMLTYLALFKLPEWKALSSAQRTFVWEQFIHPIIVNRAAQLVKMLIALAAVMSALWLGAFNQSTILSLLIMLAIVFLPSELVELVLVVRNRQAIRNVIENHRDELKSLS